MTILQLEVRRPSMEWIDRYRNLMEMGKQLKAKCGGLPVMALSVVNPRHPPSADQMSLLDEGRPPVSTSLVTLVLKFAWCLLAALRDTLEIVYLRLRVRSAYKVRKAPVSVVIKTWCFNRPPAGDEVDFYYGSLPSQLTKRGVSCVVLWDDNRESPFASARQDTENHYVPEFGLVPIWAPLWTLWQQLWLARAIRRLSRSTDDPEFSQFCDVARLESVSPLTLRNTLMYYVAKSAVERWRPKVFLTLYEGQSWESVARHGAKITDRGCLNVAYQHSIVFPHSLVSNPSPVLGELSVPDVVLSTGEVAVEIIRSGHTKFQTRVVPFGSFRRTPADESVKGPEPALRTVLVLPEGFLTESKLLFDLAFGAASLLPEYRFVFRCHPAFPFERVREHLLAVPNEYENVELSSNPFIADDFDRSSAVLYRGTSAVLYAVLAGLKPYFFDIADSPPIDPLFGLTQWRELTSGLDDFCEKIRDYEGRSSLDVRREWEPAAQYVDRYTATVTDESIDRFLMAAGLTEENAD